MKPARTQDLPVDSMPVVTAGLKPGLFGGRVSQNRGLLAIVLGVLMVVGFGFRANGLSTEGLSEDELNKLDAAADYRAHGLTAANGEHPFVMKFAVAVGLIGVEKWNQSRWASANSSLRIPIETALRLPGALFGTLSIALLFLITSELFGVEIGLVAAALFAFD